MPGVQDTRSALRPIFVSKPDMRFATSFLSIENRDFAVNGESIMDKATGEIFTKRKADGRVVSFFQNKKYLHDMMMEMRLLLNNNPTFRYPGVNDKNAYYVNTDYDVMSINREKDINILTNDMTIDNVTTYLAEYKLEFNVSKKSNGFFIRLTSRDADKAVIEYITNQYNAIIKGYSGHNAEFVTESHKFNNIEKWDYINAAISYTVTVTTGGAPQDFPVIDYCRINEESCIKFPSSITPAIMESADSIKVKINSIRYDKIRFMVNHQADIPGFTDELNRFKYPDNQVVVRYINIASFVDKSTDIELLGNEFLVALVDIPYCNKYMDKMNTLITNGGGQFLLSVTRPTDSSWKTNGVWAEHCRNCYKGGFEIDTHSETDLKLLEDYIAKDTNIDFIYITTHRLDTTDIYAEEQP